jgi:hypothetical protein
VSLSDDDCYEFLYTNVKKGYGDFSYNNEVSVTQSNKCTKENGILHLHI